MLRTQTRIGKSFDSVIFEKKVYVEGANSYQAIKF